ncbi:uncharacterized protein SAPINGB_P001009 [Magnusiomyces paraingens]|uniref:RNA polymerase II transcription factor B subunit 2 n=1 Tax=Magnusiomyces paraingens TaxID=2606893 RepID=A0A5E8B3J2_9ASCO|nr:uncharacterized protein SAPINGB_P001009 [Saprochaete ingens]VVT46025.1 unnamed protein product [Saprochaete ingens]
MLELNSSVNDYLERLPEAVLTRLFQSPATCLAIFRLLPKLAKTIVLSMLYRDEPLPVEFVDTLVNNQSQRIQGEALKKLKGLHVVKERHQMLTLNPTLRQNFKNALTGSNGTSSFGVPCETEDRHKVDIAFLDQRAQQKWEAILHYMVGTDTSGLPEGVLLLLKHSGLMDGTELENMKITNVGFQFLLQDINAQIWTLLLQYLSMSDKLHMDHVDVLNFIFMLGSLELGRDYSSASLSATQTQMLEDLREYGIVYQRKSSSRRFYPTRLATTLTSDASAIRSASKSMEVAISAASGESRSSVTSASSSSTSRPGTADTDSSLTTFSSVSSGFIIIETNFRLYAYTNSPLQIAVLNLFVHLKSRFANMVAGNITRESVRSAFMNGIKADQIIQYLTVHAHPQMAKNEPVLPPTIVDQIKLWQIEMDRIRATEGYLFTNFSDFNEYNTIVNYANQLGVVVWQNAKMSKFFVTKEGNSQVIEFVNRRMQQQRNIPPSTS